MPGVRGSVTFVLLLAMLVGCSSGPQDASKPLEESTIKPLGLFLARSKSTNRGQLPADEKAFRAFLATLKADDLRQFNLSSVDEIFTSKRDGKPYVVFYGTNPNPPIGLGSSPVVAYEQEGVNGKRYVVTELGGVEEVDEARFKQLAPGK